MLSLINKLPNYFRWMLFIPLFFVSYLLFNKFLSFSLTPVFGLYDENDPFTFIAYNLYLNTISTALAIICSAFFAPKLRRIVALSLVEYPSSYKRITSSISSNSKRSLTFFIKYPPIAIYNNKKVRNYPVFLSIFSIIFSILVP